MEQVSGKVAVITGGSSGIGRGIARALARAGMTVVITGRGSTHLDETVAEFAAEGLEVHPMRVDVTDLEAMRAAADEIERRFGRIHVLVNNAGIGLTGPVADATPADWDWVIDVNIRGVGNGIQAFLPKIRSHGEGGTPSESRSPRKTRSRASSAALPDGRGRRDAFPAPVPRRIARGSRRWRAGGPATAHGRPRRDRECPPGSSTFRCAGPAGPGGTSSRSRSARSRGLPVFVPSRATPRPGHRPRGSAPAEAAGSLRASSTSRPRGGTRRRDRHPNPRDRRDSRGSSGGSDPAGPGSGPPRSTGPRRPGDSGRPAREQRHRAGARRPRVRRPPETGCPPKSE